jgi:hypothetical protein
MATSHQSGTILHHWNDPPSTTFTTKNKSACSSTVSFGIPTPPLTPSQEINDSLICGIQGLLNSPTTLVGRNKDMIFTRVRGLIKSIEERKIPGIFDGGCQLMIDSQQVVLEEILRDIQSEGKLTARDRIVKMMSEERGIAAWATALRMVIENMNL